MPSGKNKTFICFVFKELSHSAFFMGHSSLFFWNKANRKTLWKTIITSLSFFKDQPAHNNWQQREKKCKSQILSEFMVIVLFNHGTSDSPMHVGAPAKCIILAKILKIRVMCPTPIRVFCVREDIKDGLFFFWARRFHLFWLADLGERKPLDRSLTEAKVQFNCLLIAVRETKAYQLSCFVGNEKE